MSMLVLLVLVGGPVLVALAALAAHSPVRGGVDTLEEWRRVRLVETAALVVGGLAAWLVNGSLDLGRGTMLVPAVLGLFAVAGVGLAETVVRPHRPPGPRTASLAARRIPDYLPRALAIAVAAITALHVATLALTTVTASADDLGRAGRNVAARCGSMTSAAGPYPGSFYSAPLALLLLVIGLIVAAALTSVVRRPRGFAADDVGDDVLRHRSVTRVLAAAGSAVAASQVGIAFYAGTALLRMECRPAWMVPAGTVLLVSVPVALLLLCWFVRRLVAPAAVPATASPARMR